MTCHTSSQQEVYLHSIDYHEMEKQPQHTSDMASAKRVSFRPMAEMKIVMSIHDYSEEERQACWYTMEEVKEIKRLNKHIVDIHKVAHVDRSILNVLQQQDEISERGLEHHLPSSSKLQNCKRHTMHLVMQEQYFAKFNQVSNGDEEDCREEMEQAMFELAQHYKSAAYECKKSAYMRGVNDARAAKQAWEEPKQKSMAMVQFALDDATAVVEKRHTSKTSSLAMTKRNTVTPSNFLQKLAARRRPVYSLAA